MIRIALTDAACDGASSTLPKGAAWWPIQRDQDQYFIQVEAAVVDRIEGHAQTPATATAKSSCGSSNWDKQSRVRE